MRFICHSQDEECLEPKTGRTEARGISLVSRSRIGWAFAAMDFRFRRGVSDEHTLQGSVRSEQRSLNRKDMPPGGLRRSWLLASLLPCLPAGRSVTASLRGMLLRRASPEANCGATNAHPIRERDTSEREAFLERGGLLPIARDRNNASFRQTPNQGQPQAIPTLW